MISLFFTESATVRSGFISSTAAEKYLKRKWREFFDEYAAYPDNAPYVLDKSESYCESAYGLVALKPEPAKIELRVAEQIDVSSEDIC